MQYVTSAQYSVIQRDQFRFLNTYHEEWTLYIVISGSFRCEFDGKADIMQSGDLYFIPPFVRFERSVLEKLTVHFIRFTVTDPQLFSMPCGKTEFSDINRLNSTLQMMKNTFKMPPKQQEAYLCHCMNDLLFQYDYEQNYPSKGKVSADDPLVASVMSFLQSSYAQKINMADAAARFGISPSGLIKKFRKAVGVLPQRYLINIRIQNAKQLLVNTSMTAAEIAEKTGFENSCYFSKSFKRETGMSPTEYRNAYLI